MPRHEGLTGILIHATESGRMARKSKKTKTAQAVAVAPELPQPSAAEQEAISQAKARCDARGARVKTGFSYDPATRGIAVSNPHTDYAGWGVRLQDALGTCSEAFVSEELRRIAAFLRDSDGKVHPQEVDALFAVLDGAKPENEMQAMLVIQIATTHALTMRSARTLSRCTEIPQQDLNALTLSRLQRNFTLQPEALAKLQRGGKQKVIVEHVHVYPGGQAIVGTVTHPGATGGIFQNGNQPHAISNDATLALSDDATVPCADPQREAVPVPSGEWKEALPDARRGKGIRRAKGRA